jgi:CDP-diacylglycerol--glycerol-3-phosphate 3-phosphatidyltransferase
VSLAGVLAGGAVVGLSEAGGAWLLLAALLVVLSGLLDNLDGAVAVLTDRVSAWGYVLDSVVDRLTDALYVVALWRAGAPPEVAVAGGALALLQEYARARAGAAGMREIGVVTVSERPTRVIVTAMFLAAAGVLGADPWAALGAWAWVGLGSVACVQLVVVVRRALRGQPPPAP